MNRKAFSANPFTVLTLDLLPDLPEQQVNTTDITKTHLFKYIENFTTKNLVFR